MESEDMELKGKKTPRIRKALPTIEEQAKFVHNSTAARADASIFWQGRGQASPVEGLSPEHVESRNPSVWPSRNRVIRICPIHAGDRTMELRHRIHSDCDSPAQAVIIPA